MRPLLFLLILISCGEKRSIQMGVTSKSALVEMKGGPVKTESVPNGEVLTYKNNEKFQINDEKVSASFRDPSGDERTVLFWRHAFRDCETSEKELNEESIPEVELKCQSQGKSVVFLKGTGRVVRIGEYEK